MRGARLRLPSGMVRSGPVWSKMDRKESLICGCETLGKVTFAMDGVKVARGAGGNKAPDKRGNATGWSEGAARRNRDFLMSVDGDALADPTQGEPYALSLTFGRDEFVSPLRLKVARETFFKRLRRLGMIRLHWLVEFQRDGTPHLHMLVYMPWDALAERVAGAIRQAWLEVSAFSGSAVSGQYVVPVGHLTGWKQYLAKHGIRGVRHYQRQMPAGWEAPGRMWGKLGEWPTWSAALEVDDNTFFRFRRALRSYRIATARQELLTAKPCDRSAKRKSLSHARRCLFDPREGGSRRTAMRGSCIWMPRKLSCVILENLALEPDANVRAWEDRETPPPL